ncbi:MAG TPA: Flp family type IVb pilin [Rhodopila sp.]|nr:Flp family type IVb pilin [Rhodopila sp.]
MFSNLKTIVRALLADRKGVTALEYGVIAAATVVVGMVAFGGIGTDLAKIFGNVKTAVGG